MKNTKYNLAFRSKDTIYYEDIKPLRVELESYVRELDQSISPLLESAESLTKYKTYEKLRKAACLIREALNELYDETEAIKKAGA